MERRQFIVHLSRLVLAVSAAHWSIYANSSSDKKQKISSENQQIVAVLSELAYLLLPLQPADSDVYRKVAAKLMMQMATQPGVDHVLRNGIKTLNQYSGVPWLSMRRIERNQAVSELIDIPFMAMVRWTTHELVLRNRQVWSQLGYQGSAIEHGGYLERGFNDIGWLPKQSGVADNGGI